jgi:hypothetical protein
MMHPEAVEVGMRGLDCLGRTHLLALFLLAGLAAGVWSSAEAVRAQDGLPTRPSVHTITALHQGLQVYWYEPGEDGGSALTAYDVEYRSTGAEQWTDAGHTGTSQPAVIAGLRFDTAYEVRVRARNANGAGPWSSVESRRTSRDDGKPDPPRPPALEPGDGRLKVSWTAPAYTGGRPLTGYRVRYTTDNAATWRTWAPGGNRLITGTTTTITGLDNGVTVGVTVGALNARGQGRYALPFAEAAPAPALTLSLEISRKLCTANTLTELSWTITGGVPPYTLTVEGKKVDPDAEKHRANCGPIATDPLTGDPLPESKKRFRATVTDSRTTPASVNQQVDVELAAALPVPIATAQVSPMRLSVNIAWDGLLRPSSCQVASGCFGFRTRAAGETSWNYSDDSQERIGIGRRPWIHRDVDAAGATIEASISAVRDPIELETPDVLNWAPTIKATTLTKISGLTATATHDTVTVRWNRQTSADVWDVDIGRLGGGGAFKSLSAYGSADQVAAWGDPASATHEVTFTQLPSDTEYRVHVRGRSFPERGPDHVVGAGATVRTKPAPPGQAPLVRGPQNLRATATNDTVTVSWDHPRLDTKDDYWLYIEGPNPWNVPVAQMHTTVFPPANSRTYTGLDPDTTYRIEVMHNDIVRAKAELTITTLPTPGSPAEAGRHSSPGQELQSIQNWPLNGPFAPVWPVPAYVSDPERWAWFTEDAWIRRGGTYIDQRRGEIDTRRWHGGIDIGAENRPSYRHPIQAIAEGVVREFAFTEGAYVVYCPGASGGHHMIDDVFEQDDN